MLLPLKANAKCLIETPLQVSVTSSKTRRCPARLIFEGLKPKAVCLTTQASDYSTAWQESSSVSNKYPTSLLNYTVETVPVHSSKT